MKWMFPVLFALACASSPPQDPKAELKKAIKKVGEQKSFRVKYKAVIQVPNSDPMV